MNGVLSLLNNAGEDSGIESIIYTIMEQIIGHPNDFLKINDNDRYEITDTFKNLFSLENTKDSSYVREITSNTDSYRRKYLANDTDEAKLLKNTISGEESIINQMALTKFRETPDNYDETEYNTLANEFVDYYKNLGAVLQYNLRGYLTDWQAVSYNQMESVANAGRQGVIGDTEVTNAIREQYEESWNAATENLQAQLGEAMYANVESTVKNLSIDQINEWTNQAATLRAIHEDEDTLASTKTIIQK